MEGTFSPGQQLPPERELALQFDVSRPSIREAIQRLEARRLLTRRQGGGTFVSESLWQGFSDPLLDLLSTHQEAQLDLLESRHALEVFLPILQPCVALKKIFQEFVNVRNEFLKLKKRRTLRTKPQP